MRRGFNPRADASFRYVRLLPFDEIGTGLRVLPALEDAANRVHSPADPVARFDDQHPCAMLLEVARRGETREPGTDDNDRTSTENAAHKPQSILASDVFCASARVDGAHGAIGPSEVQRS